MTTLERFLVKKQPGQPTEEKRSQESLKLEPSSDLVSTIQNLKSIFPSEREETLMLLALQHQNPRDLETAVQKLLEEKSLNLFSDSWNTVKSRDKKKPEEFKPKRNRKDRKDRKNLEAARQIDAEKAQEQRRDVENRFEERKGANYQRNNRLGKNDARPVKDKYKKVQKNDGKVGREGEGERERQGDGFVKGENEDVRTGEQGSKNTYENDDGVENRVHEPAINTGYLPKLWSEISVSPPQEINEEPEIHTPPQTIPASLDPQPKPVSNQPKQLKSPEVLHQIPEEVKPNKPKTSEIGVQVDMEYGIPIIVYPYMFQRNQ